MSINNNNDTGRNYEIDEVEYPEDSNQKLTRKSIASLTNSKKEQDSKAKETKGTSANKSPENTTTCEADNLEEVADKSKDVTGKTSTEDPKRNTGDTGERSLDEIILGYIDEN